MRERERERESSKVRVFERGRGDKCGRSRRAEKQQPSQPCRGNVKDCSSPVLPWKFVKVFHERKKITKQKYIRIQLLNVKLSLPYVKRDYLCNSTNRQGVLVNHN